MTRDHCILLVEDNPDDAMLIERAIRKANLAAPLYKVEDGQAAVDYLSGTGVYADRTQHPLPTLILLDIKLPKRSGLEVLQWIRSVPQLARLVVVMLTSSREHKDIDQAYAHSANSYLVKPIGPTQMLDLVKTLGLYWLSYNEPPAAPAAG